MVDAVIIMIENATNTLSATRAENRMGDIISRRGPSRLPDVVLSLLVITVVVHPGLHFAGPGRGGCSNASRHEDLLDGAAALLSITLAPVLMATSFVQDSFRRQEPVNRF